ncbi:uncharacterized protein MELLADRAFT_68734 [Melampsora larici-populina 98AG31]|uniref:Potassium channel tetramerisation-type BTB domain-containing protein n=1 Tax=Melampsora larici-populina (strain 98AG31 / pathotype 3-4-7) TaxID=747676 RepID=F4S7Z8_MELLP|nr:uncharacterized protein MELLADRAFT_68734 [Melampsora larici-populina 98AG31]EGF99240.1 hypothetical protein MELLADRAFT_68734 [Melampsora larici-populina 98AG31]
MQSLTSPSRTFYSSPDLAARHLASNPKLYPVSQPLTQFTPSNSSPINLSNQSQDLQNESNHRPSSDQLQSKLRINPTRSSPLSDTISSYQAWISPTPVESEVDQIVPPGTAITTTTNSPRASPRNPRESMEQISNRVNVNHAFPSVSPPRHQLKPSFTPHKEMGKPPAVILRRRPLFSAPSRPDSANLDSSQTRPISSTVGSFVSSSFETFLPNFPDPPRSSMTSHRNEIPSSTAVQRTSLISIAGNPNSSNVIPTEPVLTEPEEFDSPTSYPTASLSPPTSLDLKPLPIIPSSKSFKAHLISDLPKLTTDPNPMIVSLNVGGQIFMTLLENVVSTPSYLNDFLIQRLGLNSPEIKSSDHSQWSLNSEHHGPTTTTITRNEKVNKLNQIEIFLDRDPCNYTKILNFWRFKSIEKLRFSEDESDLIEEANWIGLVELVSLMKSNKLEE